MRDKKLRQGGDMCWGYHILCFAASMHSVHTLHVNMMIYINIIIHVQQFGGATMYATITYTITTAAQVKGDLADLAINFSDSNVFLYH